MPRHRRKWTREKQREFDRIEKAHGPIAALVFALEAHGISCTSRLGTLTSRNLSFTARKLVSRRGVR